MSNQFYPFSVYLRNKFGQRVQKVPLDGLNCCPNRDGTISSRGCIFCNPQGSGTGLGNKGMSLTEQYLHWQSRLKRRFKAELFLIYLQSFTNTHGPQSRLEKILREISRLPHSVGMCIGTRPDCLDEDKCALIARQPWEEVWLELGLQSCHDRTLKLINRGHDAECFASACEMAHRHGLKVCAHVIAGLPGEEKRDFLQTVAYLNRFPLQGVKIHNLYICQDTELSTLYKQGAYIPLTQKEYVDWVTSSLVRLHPWTVIHRLNGDPAPGELIAPAWAENKQDILQTIHSELQNKGLWQGQAWHGQGIPKWFTSKGK